MQAATAAEELAATFEALDAVAHNVLLPFFIAALKEVEEVLMGAPSRRAAAHNAHSLTHTHTYARTHAGSLAHTHTHATLALTLARSATRCHTTWGDPTKRHQLQ
jgi:hypothetical protein